MEERRRHHERDDGWVSSATKCTSLEIACRGPARAPPPARRALSLSYEITYDHHVPVTTLDLENGSRGLASFACR